MPTLHFTELPEAKPDSPLYHAWNTYRREVGRLLAEGYEGHYVLIRDEQIVGLWDSHEAALMAGYQQFPDQPFLVHQVQERERVLIGMDILLDCKLLLDGPGRRFTLEF